MLRILRNEKTPALGVTQEITDWLRERDVFAISLPKVQPGRSKSYVPGAPNIIIVELAKPNGKPTALRILEPYEVLTKRVRETHQQMEREGWNILATTSADEAIVWLVDLGYGLTKHGETGSAGNEC